MLVAARAAGIQAIDGPYLAIRDDEPFRAAVAHARDARLRRQVGDPPGAARALREAFTPTEAEVADARETLAALDARRRRRRRGRGRRPDARRGARGLARRRVLARGRASRRMRRARPVLRGPPGRRPSSTDAPALTLTEGHAALHQAIVGDRLRLALDADARRGGARRRAPLAHPALVWDVAIGQSTVATAARDREPLLPRAAAAPARAARRHAAHDDRGRRAARERARRPTGLAVLRIRTVDQEDRPVLDFSRCAMLPLRDRADRRGAATRSAAPTTSPHDGAARRAARGLDLAAFRERAPGPHFDGARDGWTRARGRRRRRLGAPELARLTLNVAMAHHDAARPPTGAGSSTAGTRSRSPPRRRRARCPGLVTIVGWHAATTPRRCSRATRCARGWSSSGASRCPAAAGSCTCAPQVRPSSDDEGDVLDWRFVGVMA